MLGLDYCSSLKIESYVLVITEVGLKIIVLDYKIKEFSFQIILIINYKQ
jgi:hypothetical protein